MADFGAPRKWKKHWVYCAYSSPTAKFLTCQAGNVAETPIHRNDIQTFAKICKQNISTLQDTIIKAIYLRRHYEIIEEMGEPYNLLASLFHKRDMPTIKTASEDREMTQQENSLAIEKIKKDIPEFDYDALIQQVKDDNAMKEKYLNTNVGYEKIQLFRIIKGQHADSVVTKFVNESFHIENEYVMQLNPHKFESVPEYVVEECSREIMVSHQSKSAITPAHPLAADTA